MEEAKPSQHHVLLVSSGAEGDTKTEVVLRYEELKQDQEGMVRKISDFIGFPLSEEQIQVTFLGMISTVRVIFNFLLQKLNEHMKFDNFQKASASNKKNPNW